MTSSRLRFIKTINVQDQIKEYIEQIEESAETQEEKKQARALSNNFDEDFRSFFITTNTKMTFAINDNLDVVIMVSSKLEQNLYDQMTQTFNAEDLHVMR